MARCLRLYIHLAPWLRLCKDAALVVEIGPLKDALAEMLMQAWWRFVDPTVMTFGGEKGLVFYVV